MFIQWILKALNVSVSQHNRPHYTPILERLLMLDK